MATSSHHPWSDSSALGILFLALFVMLKMIIRLCSSMLTLLARR